MNASYSAAVISSGNASKRTLISQPAPKASWLTSSGALVISGGVGIAKDVYIGGKLYLQGQSIDLNGAEISSNGTSVTFPNLTLGASGVITFADNTVQKTKAPQMYTNADAANGLSIADLVPGDFYYDDVTESIFIMVDTGLGYNNLLDLTVRAA